VPAAAVIPAPIAYIKIVVVKKLVVGSASRNAVPHAGGYCFSGTNHSVLLLMLFIECLGWPERLL
jgi:hypothetical protein